MARVWIAGMFLCVSVALACGELVSLPPRPSGAPTAAVLSQELESLPQDQREERILQEVLNGNVPAWNRNFVEVSFLQSLAGANCLVKLWALPDYVAVGSDADYLLIPLSAPVAQRLADQLGCVLPTRKMVDLIWSNAPVQLRPRPIPPSAEMTTVGVFARHNEMVRAGRDRTTNAHRSGALVAGHKKDVVISALIHTNLLRAKRPVVIYGWHQPSGKPIQPLYNGHHAGYADYSHGIRLIHADVMINGAEHSITNVLTDPELAPLLSDETLVQGAPGGVIAKPRYSLEEGSGPNRR